MILAEGSAVSAHVPVIYVTSLMQTMQAVGLPGVVAFSKPADMDGLLAAVGKHCLRE